MRRPKPTQSRRQGKSSRTNSTAGRNAVSVSPPSYGVDFVDSGESATATVAPPVQLPTAEGLENLPAAQPIQAKSAHGAISSVGGVAGAPAENNTGLPDGLKSGLESLAGFDLSDVRVHYDSPKPAQLNALAYTQGQEIHVGPRQERHLAHEAWHVVQQMQGRVQPTIQTKRVAINDDARLEREADVMGAKAAQLKSAATPRPARNGRASRNAGKSPQAPLVQLKTARGNETYRSNDAAFVQGNDIIGSSHEGTDQSWIHGKNGKVVKKLETWAGPSMLRGLRVTLNTGERRLFGYEDIKGDKYECFELQSGEAITECTIWGNGAGTRCGAFKLKTDKGNEFHPKMTKWGLKTAYPMKVGSGILVGLSGSFDPDVAALGFHFFDDIAHSESGDLTFKPLCPPSNKPFLIGDMIMDNLQGPTDQTFTFNASEQIQAEKSFTFSAGAELSMFRSVSVSLPGAVSLSAESSTTASFGYGKTSTSTETRTLAINQTITVPPGYKEQLLWKTDVATKTEEFTGDVTITLKKGGTFTIPIEGVAKDVSVSEGSVTIRVLKKADAVIERYEAFNIPYDPAEQAEPVTSDPSPAPAQAPEPEGELETYSSTDPAFVQNPLVGGREATYAEWIHGKKGHLVEKLETWAGPSQIRGMRVTLTNGESKLFGYSDISGDKHETFKLAAGEAITALSIWGNGAGTRCGAFRIRTNRNQDFFPSMTSWDRKTEYRKDVGSGLLCGVRGRFSPDVTSLAFVFLKPVRTSWYSDYQFPNLATGVPRILDRKDFNVDNIHSPTNFTLDLPYSKEFEQSTSTTISTGLEHSMSLSVEAGIKGVADVSSGASVTARVGSEWVNTTTKTVTREYQGSVEVPPGYHVRVTATISETKKDLRYSSRLNVILESGERFSYPVNGTYKEAVVGHIHFKYVILDQDDQIIEAAETDDDRRTPLGVTKLLEKLFPERLASQEEEAPDGGGQPTAE